MAHREYAAMLLAAIPEKVVASAREPYGARAVMYCLLLDRDAELRAHQFQVLADLAEPDVVKLTHQLAPHVGPAGCSRSFAAGGPRSSGVARHGTSAIPLLQPLFQ